MKITSYLIFNGQAEEAANFYAGVLGGTIENLYRYADFPPMEGMPPLSDEYKQRVGHCCITSPLFPGGTMGISDTVMGDTLSFGSGHMLTLSVDSVAEAEMVWERLSVDAQKVMCPLGEAFFAKRYGELTDRFGIQWAVMFE
ncbi:MAG: VOC family protein [Alistipes sp.]|jgi:PhnB protein|nr:VOC family protein [Alistipes sp.]